MENKKDDNSKEISKLREVPKVIVIADTHFGDSEGLEKLRNIIWRSGKDKILMTGDLPQKPKQNSKEMKETTKEFLRDSEDASVTNWRLAQEIIIEGRYGEDFKSKIDYEAFMPYEFLYPDEFDRKLFDLAELEPSEDSTASDFLASFGISKEAQANFDKDFRPNIERLFNSEEE